MKRSIFSILFLLAISTALFISGCQVAANQTPQAEITPAGQITAQTIDLVNVTLLNYHLQVSASGLAETFPPGCTGQPPACNRASQGKNLLRIEFNPVDLPQGDMLPYKDLPQGVAVRDNTGTGAGVSYKTYNVTTRTLTLAFEVSKTASSFSLIWPGTNPIPLMPVQQEN